MVAYVWYIRNVLIPRPCWDGLSVHHFYRTLDFAALHKDKIEKALFDRVRDLFNLQPDPVLWDATTTYFEDQAAKGVKRKNGKTPGCECIDNAQRCIYKQCAG